MPTSGKATGAILLAVLGLAVAAMIAPQLAPAVPRTPAFLVAAAFGLLTGWRMGGDRRGGAGVAAARGVTAAVAVAFWTLLCGALWQMLRRSLRGVYDGPAEALGEVAGLMASYGRPLLDPAPAAVLLMGGALAGLVAGAVAQRWP